MTSPLAIIGLTYDGADIQTTFGIFLTISRGLNETVEVRGQDVIVPGLDGQVARNRRKDSQRILLSGHVMGDGVTTALARTNYRANVTTMRTLFSPTKNPAALVVTLESGATLTIQARPLSTDWNEVVASEFAHVVVDLLSVTPDWS